MDVKSALCLFSVILGTFAAGPGFPDGWNYDLASSKGPNKWDTVNAECGENRQSPIDIPSSASIDPDLKPLSLGGYANTPLSDVTYKMENAKSTLLVSIERANNKESPIHINHNGHTWRLVQFHFHWGNSSSVGSEHTLDGKQYPAEVHLVHYNVKYASIGDAVPHSDGLLVWGHFLELSDSNNTNLERLTSLIKDIKYGGQSKNLVLFPLSQLVPAMSEDKYYTYPGSLTTPGCNRAVTWIVNQNTIKVSEYQMEEFRQMHIYSNTSLTTKIVNNFRPVQPLKGRTVKKCCDSAGVFIVSGLISLVMPVFALFVGRM